MTDEPTAPRKKSRALKTWSKRNVPDHFWPEIFPYLPVKSLLRFRSVSKYWRAAIDSPDFARLHLTRFPNNRLQSRLFVVQVTRRKPECATRCSKTLRSTAKLGFFNTDIPASHVVGSIDGLFMLKNSISSTGEQELLLWNPSIRKTRIVPPSPQQPSSERDNVVEFGLGFDPLIEDYKYVSFVQVNGYGTGLQFIEVYSIGTNSWKTIEFQGDGCSSWPERFMMNHLQRAVCLRGVLYGLAHESISLVKAYDLVSFDLNREVFASAGLPGGNYKESGLYCQTLALMDGGCSLAVVNVSSDNGCLWVPERLGDGIGSWRWSRRYVFATAFPDYDAFGWTAVKFLHLKKNDDNDGDELLLKVHNVVISYNLETHQYKTFLKKNLHEGNIWPYLESLILHSSVA